ncbi:MAG: hypothetical protein Q8S29_04710 [Phreatobacter sp.]|nr:hypothetical protein [Phreatobacter sp.]
MAAQTETTRDARSTAGNGSNETVLPTKEQIVSGFKSAGIDTEVMADTAKEKASELQELVAAEIRRKPYHALAIAATVGFIFGLTR